MSRMFEIPEEDKMEKDSQKSALTPMRLQKPSDVNEIDSVHHETDPSEQNEIIEETKYTSNTKKRLPESEIF